VPWSSSPYDSTGENPRKENTLYSRIRAPLILRL
jgi:hypothetical protein